MAGAAAAGIILLAVAAAWWIWLRPSTALTAPEGGARTCGPAGPPPADLKMFATQVVTNISETDIIVDGVTIPLTSGQHVQDWFLVGMNEYMYAAAASPDIPPRPADTEPTLTSGESKRVAVILEVTGDHTTEDHLTIEYHEDGGRTGSLTPARRLLAVPHGQECP